MNEQKERELVKKLGKLSPLKFAFAEQAVNILLATENARNEQEKNREKAMEVV